MEGILALLIILMGLAISASGAKKKKTDAGAPGPAASKARSAAQRAPGHAGASRAAQVKDAGQTQPYDGFDRDGSIDMPAREPHEHEGKPMPCPADEREAPRPRPSQLAPSPADTQPGAVQIAFSKNSMVQAVVMAEVLKRPEFKNGRRVIR